MTKIGWGVVGTGRMADWFCGDFPNVADGRLVAVGSRGGRDATEFASKHGAPRAYGSYQAVFEDPEVDVVYIATPHALHVENVGDALRAGKAVLCEKPLTVNAAECRSLIALAEAKDAYLMEAMWTYFLPAIQTAKHWLDGGRIGRVVRIKAELGYPVAYSPGQREYDAALGGGCLLEMGVYPVAIARLFAGEGPAHADVARTTAPNGVEDDVVATFTYPGLIAELGASYRCRLPNAAHIVGTDGYIVIPDAFRASECHLYVLDERVDSFRAPRRSRGYEHQAQAVCRDLLEGRRQSAVVPLALSLGFQEDIELIRRRF